MNASRTVKLFDQEIENMLNVNVVSDRIYSF